MYLATGKQLHAFILTELTINDKVINRVKNLATKEKHPDMTKGYPIFECSPGIQITYKDDKTQNEDGGIASTHEDEDNDNITENGEDKKHQRGEIRPRGAR